MDEARERDFKLSSLIREIRYITQSVNENVWNHVEALSQSVKNPVDPYAHARSPLDSADEPLPTFQELEDEIAFLKEAVNQVDIALLNATRLILPEHYERVKPQPENTR